MTGIRILRHLFLCIFAWTFLAFWHAPETHSFQPERRCLANKYRNIKNRLRNNEIGLPIYIESHDKDHELRGVVYSILAHPFSNIRYVLRDPANWCDISLLHLNIKSCTFEKCQDSERVTFYS